MIGWILEGRGKIILALVLLTGCMGFGEYDDSSPNYYSGTEGITAIFMPGLPPDEVFAGEPFPVAMKVFNKGSWHVLDSQSPPFFGTQTLPIRMYLSYDPTYLHAGGERQVQRDLTELIGKSDLVPMGDEKLVSFGFIDANPQRSESHSPETELTANICYQYATILREEVCMDFTRLQFNERDQACNSRDRSYANGQGAPVAITNVEVKMIPTGLGFVRPTFTFHVRNVGGGMVLRPLPYPDEPTISPLPTLTEEMCSLDFENDELLNTLDIYAEIGGVQLECQPDPVRLLGSYAKFFCSVPLDVLTSPENTELFGRMDNFMTTLSVRLSYAYVNSYRKRIEIFWPFPGKFFDDNRDLEPQGKCRYWQTPQGDNCIDNCNSQGLGYGCSCMTDECAKLVGKDRTRCLFGQEALCGPGLYCCKPVVCSEITNKNDCLAASETLGCSYCATGGNQGCMDSCRTCPNSVAKQNEDGIVCEVANAQG